MDLDLKFPAGTFGVGEAETLGPWTMDTPTFKH